MYERLIAMKIKNEDLYQTYREKMRPLLQKYDGGFRYDFVIEKVLKSEASHDINRVFTIHFPDQAKMESFFSDPEYKVIRDQFFAPSVETFTEIAAYNL